LSRSTSRTNLGAVPVRTSTEGQPRRSTDSARSVRTAGSSPRPAAPTAPAASTSTAPAPAATAAAPAPSAALDAAAGGGGGWGWSSMWNQASNVVQQASVLAAQAKTAAEEQVKAAQESAAANGVGGIAGIGGGLMKALGENGAEQAKKWSETATSYAKGAHLDQLGSSFFFFVFVLTQT
jgi:hypothetical protein